MPSRRLVRLAAAALLFPLASCKTKPFFLDRPRLTSQVHLVDTELHSAVLGRDIHLRLIVPVNRASKSSLPVLYLLHGAGVNFRDWANNSDISAFAGEHQILLVMPDAAGTYYINEANGHGQYETAFIQEIMPEVHRLIPDAATTRERTGLAGISRGGFGAITLGLHHPERFSFLGDISGALDLTERPFRLRSPIQSYELRRRFGPDNSPTRRANDPFLLIGTVAKSDMPYVFISCGDRDTLLFVNRRFAGLLRSRSLAFGFDEVAGGHDWSTWNEQMPQFEHAVLAHLASSRGTPRKEGPTP